MWGHPTLFHREKSIEKTLRQDKYWYYTIEKILEKGKILTIAIEKIVIYIYIYIYIYIIHVYMYVCMYVERFH